MFKVNVSFPSLSDLVNILDRTTGAETPEAGKVAAGAQVLEMGRLALNTPVASHVSEYVARLVLNTHPDTDGAPPLVKQYVRYGASPRGAQSLILGAKCNALLEGRFNVSFEDVAAVAPSALRHRLLMNFEGLAEGIAADSIIADALRATPKTR
jgi:MoxR-like ATPase